ncbi:MAG: hypothetical protein HQL21_09390 [Candidatus Omnitrophica bacterium]|nr:hypothetical protein [Candidatus Omnitrophota bacterium]
MRLKWLNDDLYSHQGRGSNWLQSRPYFFILLQGFEGASLDAKHPMGEAGV